MAKVYRAFDRRLEVNRAIKILLPAYASHPEIRKRFLAEARMTARLSHPNIVTAHDIGVDGERLFIVMELVEGGSLWDRMRATGPLTPTQSLDVMQAVLPALAHAHEQGVVHRDIKPGNILVAKDGSYKLADFGIARASVGSDGDLTRTGSLLGTPAYMAPEQWNGSKELDPRADIFAMGATLYSLVTLQTPQDLHIPEAQEEQLRPLPEPIRAIIQRAARYRASERFANAADMLEAVIEARRRLGGPGATPTPVMNTPPAGPVQTPLSNQSSLLPIGAPVLRKGPITSSGASSGRGATRTGPQRPRSQPAEEPQLDDRSWADAAILLEPPRPEVSADRTPRGGMPGVAAAGASAAGDREASAVPPGQVSNSPLVFIPELNDDSGLFNPIQGHRHAAPPPPSHIRSAPNLLGTTLSRVSLPATLPPAHTEEGQRRRRLLLLGGVGVGLLAAVGALWFAASSPDDTSEPVEPAEAPVRPPTQEASTPTTNPETPEPVAGPKGTLIAECRPDCAVMVDGKLQGTGRQTVSLNAGSHTVAVGPPGRRISSMLTVPEAGEVTFCYDMDLRKRCP